MITKTKALVKNSKATRGKGRDGLLMSERLLIGAYTNPQDAACDQSLDVTHDEYCSTEMSSVGPYRRARHVARMITNEWKDERLEYRGDDGNRQWITELREGWRLRI